MKPIFRWTLGAVSDDGIEVLQESIKRTTKAFDGIFDWKICHNSVTPEKLDRVKRTADKYNVELVKVTTRMELVNSPTMWKYSPARMSLDVHEIVVDNDIIINKPIQKILDFLEQDKTMLVSRGVNCFYGRYRNPLLAAGVQKKLNTGFLGYPPGFDLKSCIEATWDTLGNPSEIGIEEEQGFMVFIFLTRPHLFVDEIQTLSEAKDMMLEERGGYHFCGVNRQRNRYWEQYKGMRIL